MKIESVFEEFRKKYPKLDMKLASGGLADVKGKNTSDVDISLYCSNPEKMIDVFHDAKFVKKGKSGKHVIYSYIYYGREVNVYCTNDLKLANRSLIHRRNELMLNNYPLLVSQAIYLKLNGNGTEPAWAKVLGLEGDPYEAMLMDIVKLKKIASDVNRKYQNMISKLSLG